MVFSCFDELFTVFMGLWLFGGLQASNRKPDKNPDGAKIMPDRLILPGFFHACLSAFLKMLLARFMLS